MRDLSEPLFFRLTPEQLERIRRTYLSWTGSRAPCGVPHFHPYNPCLPEPWEGRLVCLTCGLRQRKELVR